jgi:hypothetical protein
VSADKGNSQRFSERFKARNEDEDIVTSEVVRREMRLGEGSLE